MAGVVEQWMASDVLMSRALHGRLVLTGQGHLSRIDVINNKEVVTPVLKLLGARPTVDGLEECVKRFFDVARPRGKQPLDRPLSCN